MQTLDINSKLFDICDLCLNDEDKNSRIDAIYDYLTDYLGLDNKNDVKEADLTSYLNDIIVAVSNENASDNKLVSTIINLIEMHSSNN